MASAVRPLHRASAAPAGAVVNDVHSQLNATVLDRIVPIRTTADAGAAIRDAARRGKAVCIAGGRHAMGGQQFVSGGVLLDTRELSGVLALDARQGLVTVQSGIQWPALLDWLVDAQAGSSARWGIRQKQTGADRLSIGGALAANIHGRGLAMRPFVDDVESFTLIDAYGVRRTCSRTEHAPLFRLVAGGYGLFGFVDTVTLRLAHRCKVRRVVEIETADRLMRRMDERIADGFTFGDFQFALDPRSDDFLHRGVFSCYQPVPDETPILAGQRSLTDDDWARLLYLVHTDKRAAWKAYATHYLRTDGQIYWSDLHQLTPYVDEYHARLDAQMDAPCRATEIISELYVPRAELASFLAEAADDFRRHDVNCVYGTVRLVEPDRESFLAWAKAPYACTIFNLHTPHTEQGLAHTADTFRRLIDMAARRGGSYYLTYHRFATRAQIERCYPQFAEFLRLKREHDPAERFQSEWYRHHRALFASPGG